MLFRSQINHSVNEMDRVTQKNAAMVEEATAASRSLAHETAQLSELVDQFNLGGEASPPRQAPGRPHLRAVGGA